MKGGVKMLDSIVTSNYSTTSKARNGAKTTFNASTESYIRGFYLISSNGDEVSLNGDTYFAMNPRGLGLDIKNEFSTINGVRYMMTQDYDPDDITFDLIITDGNTNNKDTPYTNFKKFIKYLKGGIVTLKYKMPGIDGYFKRDVALKELSKTEITEEGVLTETLTFEPLTFWYETIDQSLNDKLYINSIDGHSRSMQFVLSSQSVLEIPFRYELRLHAIYTPGCLGISNPVFRQDNFNSLYSTGIDGYGVEIPSGSWLITGNLHSGRPYAYISDRKDANMENQDLFPNQQPGKSLLYLRDGTTMITFNDMKDFNGHYSKYEAELVVKVEHPII